METTEPEWKEIEEEEKEKIESFDGEVVVLIPTPPTSSLYILNILAKISEVIRLIKKIKDKDKKNIQLHFHFLMLTHVMKKVVPFTEPLIEHYKYLIKDVEQNMDTVAQIRSHEFQSLVNNFIMSLNGLSDKEHREIISNLEYYDIEKYLKEKSIEIKGDTALLNLLQKAKEQTEEAKNSENIDEFAFDTFFTPSDKTGKYAMDELLTLLHKWDDKYKILIVMDDTRIIIEKTAMWDIGIRKKKNVALANYPNPRSVFETKSPPAFTNILSKHINEITHFKYEEKEKFFFKLLTELNSGLFSIGKGETEKTLTEEEVKGIINDGFLTIQNNIIQQLSTII